MAVRVRKMVPLVNFSFYWATNLSKTVNVNVNYAVLVTNAWERLQFVDKSGTVAKEDVKCVVDTSREGHNLGQI